MMSDMLVLIEGHCHSHHHRMSLPVGPVGGARERWRRTLDGLVGTLEEGDRNPPLLAVLDSHVHWEVVQMLVGVSKLRC